MKSIQAASSGGSAAPDKRSLHEAVEAEATRRRLAHDEMVWAGLPGWEPVMQERFVDCIDVRIDDRAALANYIRS